MNFPVNPYTPGTDYGRAFRWMAKHRRITTAQIHHVLKVDTARIRTDVKRYLRKHKLNIICRVIQHEPRNCVYEVVAAYKRMLKSIELPIGTK